ncbi:hypothetical protein RHOSPDRAFT_35280 [Rhodotorula sp. JG-1b]|nr:hypothetical protein RHOSPDRAFT_35280 [Rhodotorula sp. JG-1b]
MEQARLDRALELLGELHAQDPSHPNSREYHRSLSSYTHQLSRSSPSGALTLAANAQHVHRWKRPRNEYPDGLAGYKMWRTALNKYHADILHQVMRSAGYHDDDERDAPLFERTRDLLLKRTLQRPPLPADTALLKDPEAHLFEDAICLTFLARDFASFAAEYQPSSTTATTGDQAPARAGGLEKLGKIVSRTWAKMTVQGRRVAVDELVQTLDPELQTVVVEAVTACELAEKEAAVGHSAG